MAPSRASSLPNFRGLSKRSPYDEAQTLCSVAIAKRRAVREAVHSGNIRMASDKRLRFASFERGMLYDQLDCAAKPPKYLPPLEEVLRSAVHDLQLDFPPQRDPDEMPKRNPAFGGSGAPKVLGPRLPLRRPRLEVLAASDRVERSWSAGSGGAEEASMLEESHLSDGMDANAEVEQQYADELAKQAEPSPRDEEVTVAKTAEELAAAAVEADARKVEEDLPFPWTQSEMRSVFSRYDTDCDGEIQTDEVSDILTYLGARHQPGDCEMLVGQMTNFATISWDEFLDFMTKFRDLDISRLRAAFKAADKDGTNSLDGAEVFQLLVKLDFYPTQQSCMEAMEAADCDNNGRIDFFEFEQMIEHLRRTEGMTLADVEELRTLYSRCAALSDTSGSHEPLPSSIWHITMFLGYAATKEEIEAISAEVDADGSDAVTFAELLKIIRTVRDAERLSIKKVMASFGDDATTLPIENIGIALNELGYFVAEESVFEILDTLGELEDEDFLTLDELVAFLRQYRKVEGFTNADMKDLEVAFNLNARKETCALRTLEVGRVLRWFGFSRTVQEVQNLVESIDFDCSGELELNEFVKLMRRMHQDEAKQRQQLYDAVANPNTGEVHVKKLPWAVGIMQKAEPTVEQVRESLRRAGKELGLFGDQPEKSKKKKKKEKKEEETKEEEHKKAPELQLQFLDRAGFEAFFRHFRQLAVEEVRSNVGYSAAEVNKFRDIFEAYDKDGGGTIARSELVAVLSEYFPESTKSKEGQKAIERAIAEIDSDGNCELDFAEFLRLMRMCDDQRDASDLELELEVVKQCDYAPEEVEGFRQIFSQYVNWAGEVSLESIVEIIGQVKEFRDNDEEQLMMYLYRALPECQTTRFPNFLKLLKGITEDNVCDINQSASRVVAQEQKKKGKG